MAMDFVPYGAYEDIINILGKWKVMDIKSLSDLNNYDLKYLNLCKKVRKLEAHGLIKSVLLGKKSKHVFLTNKGLTYTPYDHTYEISDENITHDIIVGKVLKELIAMPQFIDGRMFHEIAVEHLLPDAQVVGVKNKETYKLAVEVELTQKSQSRVKEKYRRFGRDNNFNYAFFITNKETLFKAYKRYLLEMNSATQEAIILMLNKSLSVSNLEIEKGQCFYNGIETSFDGLFSDKNNQDDE